MELGALHQAPSHVLTKMHKSVLQRRSGGQQIAETFLSFDRQNDKGQAIWRGSVNEMASVTLVHLASRPAQSGDQVSVGYDG